MIRSIFISFVALSLMNGCASFSNKVTEDAASSANVAAKFDAPASREVNQGVLGWYAVSLFIDWPENQGPDWYVDAFLADTLFKDVLNHHDSEITLWRFHRRAVRDATGHRFSFRFYGDQDLADVIYKQVEEHTVTRQLLNAGMISSVRTSPRPGKNLPRIADTSDATWSQAMQASWPYFAMGVSQSWLALIEQVARTSPVSPGLPSLQRSLSFYRSVNDEVTQVWRNEGGHAYLHHLNALFGYQEVIVKERRATRF